MPIPTLPILRKRFFFSQTYTSMEFLGSTIARNLASMNTACFNRKIEFFFIAFKIEEVCHMSNRNPSNIFLPTLQCVTYLEIAISV